MISEKRKCYLQTLKEVRKKVILYKIPKALIIEITGLNANLVYTALSEEQGRIFASSKVVETIEATVNGLVEAIKDLKGKLYDNHKIKD